MEHFEFEMSAKNKNIEPKRAKFDCEQSITLVTTHDLNRMRAQNVDDRPALLLCRISEMKGWRVVNKLHVFFF